MPNSPTCAVIIVAAGRGSRAGTDEGPKQYVKIGGETVLSRSVRAFTQHELINHVIVCIHRDDENRYNQSVEENHKLLPPTFGGDTRQDSVFAGLNALEDLAPDYVLIHDAARPFVHDDTINNVISGLTNHQGSLPAHALADTVKRGNSEGLVVETVPRDHLFAAQTPQGFHFPAIFHAHKMAQEENRHDFTDDSALVEWNGMTIKLVESSPANVKLTTQSDLAEARKMMATPIPDIRTGHGYDVHQLVDGTSIRLCGVDIPHTQKLSGHSDADVGLHALTDALLATISDGDIGSHFPPSDAKWKGADSDQFLEHAVTLVKNAGGHITHCDVTLICEEPKIGPHRDSMRQSVSSMIGIDVSRISVKATTNERIGFIGREEGIAAIATATVAIVPNV